MGVSAIGPGQGARGALTALLLLAGCQSGGGGGEAADAASLDAITIDAARDVAPPEADAVVDAALPDVPALPPARCNPGTLYEAGTPVFVERTLEVGFFGVRGNRLSVGDIDGDGWADVSIRNNRGPDIFETNEETGSPGPQRHFLMRNKGGQGFEDVAVTSGFSALRGTYPYRLGRPIDVVAFADIDNDGDMDAYSGLDAREPIAVTWMEQEFEVAETSELLINDGSGHFELAPEDHPLRRVPGLTVTDDFPDGAAFVDYDRDGFVDLWITQGGTGAARQDRLYRNDAGTWLDATGLARLTTEDWRSLDALNEGRGHNSSWSAAACDLNDDGWPELLSASYGRLPNQLWQANGDGTYANRSVPSGYAFDGDMTWQEDEFAKCYCQANPQAEGCDGVGAPRVRCAPNWDHDTGREPFRLGGNSGATVCADFDNDGAFDLYTAELKHWWAGSGADQSELLHNTGEADVRFVRPGRVETGLDLPHPAANWDEGFISAGAFDFDNDGRRDLYVGGSEYAGNRGHLWHNVSEPGAPRFEELPTEDFFEHNRSLGMAVADFDHDGDLDLMVGHSRQRCDANLPNDCYPTNQVRYFENTLGQDGNWVQLDLAGGPESNRGAIGARVTLAAATQTQVQEVTGGYGHTGAQEDRVLHFGLGPDCEAEVTVRWPDQAGTTQTFTVVSGYRYRVEQGGAPVALEE